MKIQDHIVTLGSDPELFLRDVKTSQLVSSIGLIGGTKDLPLPMPEMPRGFAMQEDNVAVEFNIPPAEDIISFTRSIQGGLGKLEEIAKGLDLVVAIESAVYFPPELLNNPQAQTFGCTPDFNAWTGRINPRPMAGDSTLRSAGGHIHIGIAPKIPKHKLEAIVRVMDLFLGVPSVMMEPDSTRRKLYGKAGAYRMTPYGVEYRVLSNFWIRSPELCEWAYNSTINAIEVVLASNDDANWISNLRAPIHKAINESDMAVAHRLIVDHNLNVR